jgi:hypothetical protein
MITSSRRIVRERRTMSEQDKEYLEALYAGFAMVGFLMNGDYSIEEIPTQAKQLAKSMMVEEPDKGIVAVKRRFIKKEK